MALNDLTTIVPAFAADEDLVTIEAQDYALPYLAGIQPFYTGDLIRIVYNGGANSALFKVVVAWDMGVVTSCKFTKVLDL